MKAAWVALCLGAAALSAAADDEDFKAAAAAGPWSGCVYEEGYDPYPITLTPRGKDFFVDYPGLCTGGHLGPDIEAPYDAIEIIVVNADRCVQGLPVTYTLDREQLRIDYHAIATGAYALLQPTPPGMTHPACSTAEAIS
ncbi:hypothetical protein WNY37_16100 [Henriciella sp. AS95]|uniref:hypothetical protein n=1 Tax=Henriciella sp. AS95 TaxID=3135782 RepID=UPI003172F13B